MTKSAAIHGALELLLGSLAMWFSGFMWTQSVLVGVGGIACSGYAFFLAAIIFADGGKQKLAHG